MIPEPFEFLLLALIAYRSWRLLAEDEILAWPRNWLVRLPRKWEEGDPIPKEYREKLALFVTCPWCAGAWVSGVIYIAYLATLGEWPKNASDVFVGIGVWFAVSASVGLIRSTLDPPEEE
jgi:hypothetical protein